MQDLTQMIDDQVTKIGEDALVGNTRAIDFLLDLWNLATPGPLRARIEEQISGMHQNVVEGPWLIGVLRELGSLAEIEASTVETSSAS